MSSPFEDGMRQLPIGVRALIGFFTLGACASGSSFLALIFPDSPLRHIWRLNPPAHDALVSLGAAAVALMLAVCAACSGAAIGLFRRTWWGHRLAVGILVVNLIGDSANALLRGDLRTLIGVPIGAALIAYLLRSSIRQLYRKT